MKSHREPAGQHIPHSFRYPVIAVIENIRSLYNVGSIFRTCDGAAVEKLYLCGYTGTPPRKEIDKTALGSVEVVPWEHCESALELIGQLQRSGVTVYGLEVAPGSRSYDEVVYRFPAAVVLGNEVSGLSTEICHACDEVIHLPMHGVKESLNVAVAAGIILYHMVGKAGAQ